MSEQGNTMLTLAGLAGVVYFGHRWLTDSERKRPGGEADADPVEPVAAVASAPVAEPVSKPSQVEGANGRGHVSRRFDAVFATHGRGIPLPYLRALAARESDLRPDLTTGPAWGLLQVEPVVLADYNKRHGTTFRRADLLSPAINVAVAADALRVIIASYRRFHPDVVNLREDWDNPRFVELLTFGWNAGFSERAGVGRVVTYLGRQGVADVTVDMVFAHAAAAGAVGHLSREGKLRFAKAVTRLYQRERARTDTAAVG
ncbi:MAG: lytic transglycosylase domain-containing protein [Kofleriaceae bacterium]|nr:lytic transglycosylase domain-containing protein [Myxococcales bacterium]MCB9564111.1 lytic transglycosylase domain-containing protein [Kofleriaceae bacterium]MCB9572521.1 lytic transglycosylase domain-containing protein [Kofleriaceae bacterium]